MNAPITLKRTSWSEMRQVDTTVTDAPDLSRRKTREAFQPDYITVTLRRDHTAPEWRLAAVLATGPLRLKSGGLSIAEVSLRSWVGAYLAELPDWLRTIADKALSEARHGVAR